MNFEETTRRQIVSGKETKNLCCS